MKRRHEATLLELQRLQEAYQALELKKEALVLSNTIIDGEKKDIEDNILELEAQKVVADKQAEELKDWVADLEAWNNSLETQLKVENEWKVDITPLQEHALLIRRKTYQV